MIIIVYTNIIISACLESKCELYKILTTTYTNVDFTTSEFTLAEIIAHQNEICVKSKKSLVLFKHNLLVVLRHLVIKPDEGLSNNNILEAETFAATVYIDDTIFIAFAMA